MRPLLFISILLLAACGNNSTKTTQARPDSIPVAQVDTPEVRNYVPIQSRELGDFRVSILAVFRGQQSHSRNDLERNILVYYNKITGRGDTLDLDENESHMPGDTDKVNFKDITRDIRFEKPAVIVGWESASDYWNEELVSIINDTLKVIYDGGTDSLKRTDKWTLTGLTPEWEPVTGSYYDSRLTISLRTLEAVIKTPDTLVTDYHTESKDTIRAWRFFKTGDYVPYTILPGKKLILDTVLHAKQTVIMHMDSVILRTTTDKIEGRILVSIAG